MAPYDYATDAKIQWFIIPRTTTKKHHKASNNPPAAKTGNPKAGAVIAGCAIPVLRLVGPAGPLATPAVTVSHVVLTRPSLVTVLGLTTFVTVNSNAADSTLLV